jgi:co-chaperonin GroES (HSP10)
MNVRLFGHRCLLEFYRPETKANLVIPDSAQQHDSHRLGIVRFVGDGLDRGKQVSQPSLVKENDVVLFQINAYLESNQSFVLAGKHYMNLLQNELVARIHGSEPILDNLEILGNYVLLGCFLRMKSDSKLIIPETVKARQSLADSVYFTCIQKGSTVDLPIKIGDELIVNSGRLTPLFIVHPSFDGKSQIQEFAYIHKDWVEGVVDAEDLQLNLNLPQ